MTRNKELKAVYATAGNPKGQLILSLFSVKIRFDMKWSDGKFIYIIVIFLPSVIILFQAALKDTSILEKGKLHDPSEIVYKIMWVCAYVLSSPPLPTPPAIGARTFMGFCKSKGPMLFCVIPAVCCVKLGCHTYKEFRQDLVQILLIGSTHIPAWSVCHRGVRALSWAWNKPPSPRRAQGICSLPEGRPGGSMMRSGLCFRYALISQMCQPVCAVTSPRQQRPAMEKAWGIMGLFVASECVTRVSRQRGTEAHTFLTHHLHTRPGKGNDWGHITQSASPLVLVTMTSNTHKGTLLSLVFSSKPFLGVTCYLYWFTLNYFGITYILRVVRRYLKSPKRTWTF